MRQQRTDRVQNSINASRAKEQGLTLVEAVIALLVTVVGVVSLAGIFTIAMRTNASSHSFTTATTFAQDKLEQLGTMSFQRLVNPDKMRPNPGSRGSDDAFIVGSLDNDAVDADGNAYFDKIILAGKDDSMPEGTVTILFANGTAETRMPDGTVTHNNPFPESRVNYSRRWVIMSSNEPNPADRRLTIAVRVKSENATASKSPELVDLYTVMSNQ
jgi:hypothetical protein